MAIERNAGSSGSFINAPGEYLVKVTETKTGMSKAGKPMLTVTFETDTECSIKSYFVKTLAFHMKALEQLKLACGIKMNEPADNLIGLYCGILVEANEPTDTGKVFMGIVGYGKGTDVNLGAKPSVINNKADDEVPF